MSTTDNTGISFGTLMAIIRGEMDDSIERDPTIIAAYSAAMPTSYHQVTWRSAPTWCCASQGMLTDWSNTIPVWVDNSFGELRPDTVFCGGCGSHLVHPSGFAVREVDRP